jgi:phosphatidylglycerophosphatase A
MHDDKIPRQTKNEGPGRWQGQNAAGGFVNGLARWIAAGGGFGFAPIAPGTFGSLPALLLVYITFPWPLLAKLALLAAICLLGWWASEMAGRQWGHDDSRIVIDEVAGQYLSLLFIPVLSLFWLAAGFLAFRVFDIWKPQPARALDRRKGGAYTMADDLAAGLYAMLLLMVIEHMLS